MVLIGITSFILGVKVGKSYSYKMDGFTEKEKSHVELLSKQEEHVQEVLSEQKKEPVADTSEKLKEKMNASLKQKLMEEIANEGQREKPIIKDEQKVMEQVRDNKSSQVEKKESSDRSQLTGKYTLQVGVFKKVDGAKSFAEGIKLRGYNTYIDELDGRKGTLYRVSLGVFNNIDEAKEYMIKEKSFFQGESPIIVRFE